MVILELGKLTCPRSYKQLQIPTGFQPGSLATKLAHISCDRHLSGRGLCILRLSSASALYCNCKNTHHLALFPQNISPPKYCCCTSVPGPHTLEAHLLGASVGWSQAGHADTSSNLENCLTVYGSDTYSQGT